jgi:hypothetical protein
LARRRYGDWALTHTGGSHATANFYYLGLRRLALLKPAPFRGESLRDSGYESGVSGTDRAPIGKFPIGFGVGPGLRLGRRAVTENQHEKPDK